MTRQRNRRRPGGILAAVATYATAVLIALVFLAPLALVLLTSVKGAADSQTMSFSLPSSWHFDNYLTVIRTGNALQALGNSVLISAAVTAVTVLVCSLAAFVIARRPGRVTGGVYSYLLTGLIAPFAFIPAIRLLQEIGLGGSYLGLILTDVAVQIPFITLIYVGFIRQLPKEIDEAAMLDGAGSLRMFFTIIFPLLRPVSSTALILVFTYAWNEFQNVLFLIPDADRWTLPMTVFTFQSTHSFDYGLVCADLVLTMVPVVAVYLTAQKYIVNGMVAGAVKA
ncbi:carbohydrate ABC transporter permease [Streptomyces sp. LS1784]|uniref:carbohydrate ABC transporter permease n=1 Tax=Streptomyces sp. LS1784 TaxID=2851533 RepID=UPI001CCCFAA8|nr:carbohydrate ABC transporter permease [Streptomyces sp. LS1784]